MEEAAETMAEQAGQGTVRKGNGGWFKPGDKRINVEGRPKGKVVLRPDNLVVDCAPRTDRLMLLVIPERDLAFRLTKQLAPWFVNLPLDYEIVASRVDTSKGTVVFMVRSREFHQILKGTPIPQFRPEFNGLRWRRGERVRR
jgi:hypothetical protein